MSPARKDLEPVAYRDAKFDLNAGDVALFRARRPTLDPRSWKSAAFGAAITWLGRSDYSHAGMLVAVEGEFYVAEMLEGVGGRLWPLAKYAASHSGAIDLFRPAAAGYRPREAARRMLTFVGQPYGWWAIQAALALHLPVVRHLARARAEAAPWSGPLFCSAAVAVACELGGGVDPVPELATEHTEPGDLARSGLIGPNYLLTIVADEPPAQPKTA